MELKTLNQSALLRVCPVCNAQEGEPCTQPTDTGRTPVRWFHYKRLDRIEAEE